MSEHAVNKEDVLTPLSEFEERHNIQRTREDIPYKFLGRSPSKYYRNVDMDLSALFNKVAKLFKRVYNKGF